jgi:glucose/arabinose dehydrogenase
VRRYIWAASVAVGAAVLLAGCAGSVATQAASVPSIVASLPASAATSASAAQSTPAPSPSPSASAAPSPSTAVTVSPTPVASATPQTTAFPAVPVGQLGGGLSVSTASGGSATVGVVDARKHASCGAVTPAAGDAYVAVSVGYSADRGSLRISPLDWVVVDGTGRASATDATVVCEKGTFTAHTLAKGGNDGGWIVFEIAANAKNVRLYYAPADAAKARWRLW